MTSVDEIFQRPGIAVSKRKWNDVEDPNELYKKVKLKGTRPADGNNAAAEHDTEEESAAGPEMPPDSEDGGDDDEGRFFGGGISNDTADVLDFIDEQEKDGAPNIEKIDISWVRRIAVSFERKITKNAELRAKYEDQPQKFMSSEADLDAEIKALSILSEHPELYQEFASLGCVASLMSLLAHENTDIAIGVVEVTGELIDEDVEAEQDQWDSLVDAMLDSDLIDLISQNLSRLNEEEETDRAGVYHVLGVLESLLSRSSLADKIGDNASMIEWLLGRAARKEKPVSQNKQYSAEILAILLQSSQLNVNKFLALDGVDTSLQVLSAYRKIDPVKGSEEEEFMENIFDCLTCAVDDSSGKAKFLDAEGIELCILMLKEGGPLAAACAENLIEAAGLKQLFSIFMKKQDGQSSEHTLGIIASLLRLLPGDSAPRIRLLGKFVEKDYQKITRLMGLRHGFIAKLDAVDKEIDNERTRIPTAEHGDHEDEWLGRRLEAGSYSLQTINVILAWLAAEDDGAKQKIVSELADRDESIKSLRESIQDQLNSVSSDAEDSETTKDMLSTLANFLT